MTVRVKQLREPSPAKNKSSAARQQIAFTRKENRRAPVNDGLCEGGYAGKAGVGGGRVKSAKLRTGAGRSVTGGVSTSERNRTAMSTIGGAAATAVAWAVMQRAQSECVVSCLSKWLWVSWTVVPKTTKKRHRTARMHFDVLRARELRRF